MDEDSFDEFSSGEPSSTSESDEETGLKTPLLNRRNKDENQSTNTIDTDDTSESEDDTVKTKTGSYPYVTAAATALLAVGGVAASASAIIAVPSTVVYILGGMCMITSPWMAVNHHRIVKEGTGVRKRGNQLRVQSNLLKEEGRILKETVTDLKEEVQCLHDVQKELDGILADQGWNRDKTVALVNENECVLNQLKDCLREVALSDITRIVLSSDKNGDMTINLKELRVLTLRIKLTLEMRGVDFDDEVFVALVRHDNDISHVLKVIATIMFEEDSIDDQDFGEYTKEAVQNVARQENLSGSMMLAGSVIGKMRNIARKVENDRHMFTIQDKFSRGSVDTARGTRVSLSRHSHPHGRTTLVRQRFTKSIKASNILHRQAKRASEGRVLVGSLDEVDECTEAQEAGGENGDGRDIRRKALSKGTRARELFTDLDAFTF